MNEKKSVDAGDLNEIGTVDETEAPVEDLDEAGFIPSDESGIVVEDTDGTDSAPADEIAIALAREAEKEAAEWDASGSESESGSGSDTTAEGVDGDEMSSQPSEESSVFETVSETVPELEENPELEEDDEGDVGDGEEPPKKFTKKRIALIAILILALAVCGFGIYRVVENKRMTAYYEDRYLPGTTIDGVDCAGLTVEEAVAIFEEEAQDYSVTLTDVYGDTDVIAAEDFGLTAENFTEEFQEILDSQDPSTWRKAAEDPTEVTVTSAWEYDAELLEQRVEESELFADMIESVDAYIYYDESSGEYELVEAVIGNVVDVAEVVALVEEAVAGIETELSLVDAGLYEEVIESTDAMASAVDELNLYASCSVSLDFGSAGTETMSKSTLRSCLSYDEDYNVTISSTPIANWVADLADEYDTVGTKRSLSSTSSGTVTVSGGTYGWEMNQSSTVSAIVSALQSGESYSGEPTWTSEAASHSSADWGSSYIEVDLDNQIVYLYMSGSLVWSSSCVSGDPSEGHKTIRGVYYIYSMETNRTLRGALQEDGTYAYESFVYYWMPFYKGYGLHDATWRTNFGGTIYSYNGSHGCVNLPLAKAEALYDLIYVGLPVLVFGGYDNYEVPTTTSTTTTSDSTDGEE